MTKLFKIESDDINRLNDIQLTRLLDGLLHAESYKFDISQRAAEVALNINVGDGGEDGRISWEGGPEQTDYLPNRLTMFQNKATDMAKAAYANEIMTTARPGHPSVIKPKVEEVLDQSGSYIVFTTQELNTIQKDGRINSIREKLHEQGKAYANTCDIKIFDAVQIASWVNQFISTIVLVQHWSGNPTERGLKNFSQWHDHEEMTHLPFVSVDSRRDISEAITAKIEEPKSCFRVMGLSGLGKTRTALQVFVDNESLRSLVVYVDANHAPTIDALVSDWVGLGLKAIVIVDNCEYRLHERLVREVRREDSKISLLTLDYNFDSVANTSLCFKLDQMTDEELMQLLSPIYRDQLADLDRIVAFAQGFPQMAVLLAEARLSEDPKIGELSEDDLANKLLWRRGEAENRERLMILQVCSLFDVFGIENEVEVQLEYISSIVGIDIDQVYRCIQDYSERGLVDRRGRFGQLVPKPLAIRLASQWWTQSRSKTQINLVEGIPADMIEGFCRQIEKLDFHPNVKELTEKLCGLQGPFGQAEVILSVRGSRLFRAFVNVNPESTNRALYNTLNGLDHEQLGAIGGDTRRNLIGALERLCFHANLYKEAAWSMLLLASAENESWVNNATGMFAQLYDINLSGTEAPPNIRLSLLNQALELKSPEIDMVILEALNHAINTQGGTRSIGAEFQGTKPPLEEWRPKVWQEIFDHWQEAFNMFLILFERGEDQKEKVLGYIGASIRDFTGRGRLEMLDSAIRHIVSKNGRYWPAALDSIKNALLYDSKGMKQEATDALNSWLKLLSSDGGELSEKLKIVVINPPWEHYKGEDGKYIDVASQEAKTLATEVSQNIDDLIPHLHLLLEGVQQQSNAFGYQLAHELVDVNPLLNIIFEKMNGIKVPNLSLVNGIYNGVFDLSPEAWQDIIDRLLADDKLIHLYPYLISTGNIQKSHLDILLHLIRTEVILPKSADVLMYGSVTRNITEEEIADFCLQFAELGDQESWIALNIIYMYCFGKKDSIQKLRGPLKSLITTVSLNVEMGGNVSDMYNWNDLSTELLMESDEKFAIELSNKLFNSSLDGLNASHMYRYTKPLIIGLMQKYGDLVWPILSDAIVQAEGMARHRLQMFLKGDYEDKVQSLFSVVPVEKVISWCEEFIDLGPSFVAGCLNVWKIIDDKQEPSPLFIALLEQFGGDKRVASALESNLATRSWMGSLIPYLEADKEALTHLLQHENGNVSTWVKNHISNIDWQIKQESIRDEEGNFGFY